MCTSPYRTTGWGHPHGWDRGHRGSPLMLAAGILVIAALFKSGLWLPLLGLGALAFAFARMNGGDWGPRTWQGSDRHPGWSAADKPKRPFGPMGGRPWYGHFEPEAETEKPKREQRNDDEYV